jgi:hypothetical protein
MFFFSLTYNAYTFTNFVFECIINDFNQPQNRSNYSNGKQHGIHTNITCNHMFHQKIVII